MSAAQREGCLAVVETLRRTCSGGRLVWSFAEERASKPGSKQPWPGWVLLPRPRMHTY